MNRNVTHPFIENEIKIKRTLHELKTKNPNSTSGTDILADRESQRPEERREREGTGEKRGHGRRDKGEEGEDEGEPARERELFILWPFHHIKICMASAKAHTIICLSSPDRQERHTHRHTDNVR